MMCRPCNIYIKSLPRPNSQLSSLIDAILIGYPCVCNLFSIDAFTDPTNTHNSPQSRPTKTGRQGLAAGGLVGLVRCTSDSGTSDRDRVTIPQPGRKRQQSRIHYNGAALQTVRTPSGVCRVFCDESIDGHTHPHRSPDHLFHTHSPATAAAAWTGRRCGSARNARRTSPPTTRSCPSSSPGVGGGPSSSTTCACVDEGTPLGSPWQDGGGTC